MKFSDFRIQPGERKGKKKRNPFRATPGKGARSDKWAAYVKANSKAHPSLNG
jgi:hypothetical protein